MSATCQEKLARDMPIRFARRWAFSAGKPSRSSAFSPTFTQSSADNLSTIPEPYRTVLTGASRSVTLSIQPCMESALLHDLALQTAGVLAILVALTHGVLGERRVFARATIEPPSAKRLIRLVWQCSTVAWLAGGVLLLALPFMAAPAARVWIIAVFVGVYGFAAIANAWATRGRHFGW